MVLPIKIHCVYVMTFLHYVSKFTLFFLYVVAEFKVDIFEIQHKNNHF